MHHRRLRSLAMLVVASLIISPLSAMPLSTIVEKALSESAKMQDLELTKRDTLLTIGRNQAEDGVGVSVSGDLTTTLDLDSPSTTLRSSGVDTTITLPNDGKTSIQVSTGALSYGSSGNTYSVSPTVGASHTFTYGLTGDNRKSLTNRQTEVLATSTYDVSRVNYTTSLYSQIATILDERASRRLPGACRPGADPGAEPHAQAREEDSLIHGPACRLQSKGLRDSTQLELYLRQFRTSGFEWEGLRHPGQPPLPRQSQSGTLKLKSLAVDLAKEDLAIQKATYTNKSLAVGGSVGYSSSKSEVRLTQGAPLTTVYGNDLTVKGSASFGPTNKQYSISGSVTASYDFEDNTFTPSLTIGGSWSNNPSSYSEGLKLQQLENAVLTAELAYRTAIDEFNQSVMTIQNSIASYVMNYSLLLEFIAYNQETLEQQKDLYARGLATALQVEDAQFAVDLDTYTLNSSLLEGLKLENQIKSLSL